MDGLSGTDRHRDVSQTTSTAVAHDAVLNTNPIRQWNKWRPRQCSEPWAVAMGEGLEQLAAQAQAHRPASADAEAIVFLATDRASFIYGAKLAVDGGRTAILSICKFKARSF